MTVSEKLRLVQGLHSHAEMFGFNWNDDSNWTWHDVACKIADEIDAENAKMRELAHNLHTAYVGMVERYRSSEEGLIWECSGSIEEDGMKLRQECDEEHHKFDAAMREMGIEVDE